MGFVFKKLGSVKEAAVVLLIFAMLTSWFYGGWPQILNFPPEIDRVEAMTPQNGRAAFITAQDPHTYWELNSTNLGTNYGHDATTSGGDNPAVASGDISTSDSYEGMNNQNDPTISGDLDVMIVTDSAWLMYIPAGLGHGTHYGIWHNGGGTNAQGTGVRATATGVEIACTHNNAANVMDTVIVEIPDASLPSWFAVGCQLASYGGTQGDMALWIDGVAEGSGTRVNALDYGSGNPDFGNFAGTDPDQSDVIYPVSYSGGDWGANTAITGSGILIANFTADNPTDAPNDSSGDSAPGAGDDFYTDFYDMHTVAGPVTKQLHYRWRDDTTDLNTGGGWLASEDTQPPNIDKNDTIRLRIEVANTGTAVEVAQRTYELEYALVATTCSAINTWYGVADTGDDFDMVATSHIDPDGESTTGGLLANSEGYTRINGEGREALDTTGLLGAMSASNYTELEYSFKATDDAEVGAEYCFRVYDATAGAAIDTYSVYPQVQVSYVAVGGDTDLEWGTEASVSDTAWSTVNFSGTYTNPVFICSPEYNANIGNEVDGNADSLVCRVQSLGSTSAQVRLQRPSTTVTLANAETVQWMVVEEGSYDTPEIKLEAASFSSTVTGAKSTYSGETQTCDQTYTNPVVLGQVMSYNDTSWSTFLSRGSAVGDEPSCASMILGKQVQEDTDTTRSDEDIGYIIVEQGHGNLAGDAAKEYEAFTQAAYSVGRVDSETNYAATYQTAFSSAPGAIMVANAGISGTDGPHFLLYGSSISTATDFNAQVFEDELVDDEQTGNTEKLAYFALEGSGTVFLTDIAFDQNTYRFYDNADSVQPGATKAAENTAITNVATNDIVRIRMTLQAGINNLLASDTAFTLQYGEGATCSGIGSWTDVGAAGSGVIWRGYDNASPADGASITSSLLDATTNALESYEEGNNSVVNPVQIVVGSRGEWDWVVQNNGATASTEYCFRMLTSADDVLGYTRYPEVTTAGAGGSLSLTASSTQSFDSSLFVLFNSQTSTMSKIGAAQISDDRGGSPGWVLNFTGNDWKSDTGAMQLDYDGTGSDDNLGKLCPFPNDASLYAESGSMTGVTKGANDCFSASVPIIDLAVASSGNGTGVYWLTDMSLEQYFPSNPTAQEYTTTVVFTIQ